MPSGKIINSELLETCVETLAYPVKAKQAWTDVAQLSELGIPCFNCGPGHQSQAHVPNEYASIELITEYQHKLTHLLLAN